MSKPPNVSKAKPLVVKTSSLGSGPVSIKRIPSLRGKNSVTLHAAGAFLTAAPDPSDLPMPPPHWAARHNAAVAAAPAPAPPTGDSSASRMKNADLAAVQLHGNILILMLGPLFPAERFGDLAGKITGMFLEGLDRGEIGQLLADEQMRKEYIKDALEVSHIGIAIRASAIRILCSGSPTPCPPRVRDSGALPGS